MYAARTHRDCSILKAKRTFEHEGGDGHIPFGHGPRFAAGVPSVNMSIAAPSKNVPLKKAEHDEFGGKEVWVGGRVVGILDDGFVLQDESGRVDVVTSDELRMNVGDIVECLVKKHEGEKGEPLRFALLDLAVLAPCKEDFFIKKEDPNFLKMIVDLQKKYILDSRAEVIKKIRMFFWNEGFVETDTPELVRHPGMEPYLDVFKTRFFTDPNQKEKGEDLYLITSPEYALKKLLVSGYEKIFQVAKSFRNKETASSLHNPEFTLLEWYRAYASYLEIMDDTENLVRFLAKEILRMQKGGGADPGAGGAAGECGKIIFQGHEIDVDSPWERLKVKEAFKKYAGIAVEDFEDSQKLKAIAQKKGYAINEKSTYDDAFFLIFMNEIEPKLGLNKPVILYEYPVSMAALSKKCEESSKYAERFEVYIAGIELCNAFTELNDGEEQLYRLEAERKDRQKMGKDDYPVDQRFIRALDFGMPPSGGIALGVDRLVMLLTDTPEIENVLFFPHKDL